jgi:predicted Zn-dependent protease with MMP-like domain
MRAWLMDSYEGVERLRLGDVVDPQPGPAQVLLRVRFAALNPADAFLAQAMYPARPPLPHILGRDGVGDVLAVGSGVENVRVGETVDVLHGCMGANEVTIRNGMERSKFEALVAQALSGLPRTFREKLTNVAIIVEDVPPEEAESEGLLLGLFHGIPRTEKSVFFSTPPDRIFLYQRNIEAICASEAEVRWQVRATLLHEVGHYFGLSEDELRDL